MGHMNAHPSDSQEKVNQQVTDFIYIFLKDGAGHGISMHTRTISVHTPQNQGKKKGPLDAGPWSSR